MKKVRLPEVFTNSAKSLQTKFKDPYLVLELLVDSMGWVHSHELTKKEYVNSNDPHFEIATVITSVLIPIIKGDTLGAAKGLLELYELDSAEDLYHKICEIRKAYASDCQQFGAPSKAHIERDDLLFSFLMDIYYTLYRARETKGIRDQILQAV